MSIYMFSGANKDMLMFAAIMTIAAVCAFIYQENVKIKEDITTCKAFSINLANRIPVQPPVTPVVPDESNSEAAEAETVSE
jgi:hypothetical protein